MDQDEKDTSTEASKPKDRIEKVILPNGNEVIVAGIAKHTTSLGEVKNVMDSLEECVKSKGKKMSYSLEKVVLSRLEFQKNQ